MLHNYLAAAEVSTSGGSSKCQNGEDGRKGVDVETCEPTKVAVRTGKDGQNGVVATESEHTKQVIEQIGQDEHNGVDIESCEHSKEVGEDGQNGDVSNMQDEKSDSALPLEENIMKDEAPPNGKTRNGPQTRNGKKGKAQVVVGSNSKKILTEIASAENESETENNNDEEYQSYLTGEGLEHADGGAVWDIFRRQDVPKLQEYLKKHFREFRDIHCSPLEQVYHPIHDQSFYLTMDHKRKLKEEYGIEPWTFVQNLGDAVFIPAGSPHQVRNLKSCIKVALDFVSPENVNECIHLTEEFRLLPENHRAKVDKLEVKKMALHAINAAVSVLEMPQKVATLRR